MHNSEFVLKIRGVSLADIEQLRDTTKELLDLPLPQERKFGPDDWHTIFAVIQGVAVTAGAIANTAKIAKWLYDWVQARRAKNAEFKGLLQAKGKSPLDLAASSEDVIKKWLDE